MYISLWHIWDKLIGLFNLIERQWSLFGLRQDNNTLSKVMRYMRRPNIYLKYLFLLNIIWENGWKYFELQYLNLKKIEALRDRLLLCASYCNISMPILTLHSRLVSHHFQAYYYQTQCLFTQTWKMAVLQRKHGVAWKPSVVENRDWRLDTL